MKIVNNNVKKIIIFTSCDTSDNHAEFIREGFNYSYWKENCHKILKEITNTNLNIMCTFNNLCLTENFKVFISDIYDMTQHSIGFQDIRTIFNIQPLSFPIYQSIEILDYDIFEKIINEIQDLLNSYVLKKENNKIISKGFSSIDVNKFQMIKNLIKNSKINNKVNKENFIYFLQQCKIRNKKDHYDIFNDNNYRRFFSRIYNHNIKIPILNLRNDFT